MSYDFVVDIVQWALRLAAFGMIAAVSGKMLVGTISLRGMLLGRALGKVEPERILALAAAVALSALYLFQCALTLKDVAVPRALPGAEPWMLAAALASQALYLGGKFLRAQHGKP